MPGIRAEPRARKRNAEAFVFLVLLACGMGTAVPAHSAERALTYAPAVVVVASARPASVLVFHAVGALKVTVTNAAIADVSKTVVSADVAGFTVTQVAGGRTTIRVSDALGDTAEIPVETELCSPEAPPDIRVLGEVNATPDSSPDPSRGIAYRGMVPVITSWIALALPPMNRNERLAYSSAHPLRLIPRDGSPVGRAFIDVGYWQPALEAPHAPEGAAVWWVPVGPLPAGRTYRVQIVSDRSCEPPFIAGTFST